jgi:DNA repair exonuclease SbcCD ATPase subunit
VDGVSASVAELEAELTKIEQFFSEFDARMEHMNVIQEETDKWGAYEEWQAKDEELRVQRDRCRKTTEYWELYRQFDDLDKMIGTHGQSIRRIQEKKDLLAHQSRLQRVRLYQQWKKKEAARASVQETFQSMQVRLAMMKKTMQAQHDKMDQIGWYRRHIEEWTTARGVLLALESKFMGDKVSNDGYKEWIYREKVVPLVENEVNRFLSTVESIRLRIRYEKKSLLYFLEDRGNLPTLDKASGYQNFVVSLAMRLALARIGAIGQNVSHLFIDEGFTACDVNNIEKVPQLLRGIMSYGGYRSILIMSHLEQVQEACEARIDIERSGMFSAIRYGEEYPCIALKKDTVPADTTDPAAGVKKRGRPKKTPA